MPPTPGDKARPIEDPELEYARATVVAAAQQEFEKSRSRREEAETAAWRERERLAREAEEAEKRRLYKIAEAEAEVQREQMAAASRIAALRRGQIARRERMPDNPLEREYRIQEIHFKLLEAEAEDRDEEGSEANVRESTFMRKCLKAGYECKCRGTRLPRNERSCGTEQPEPSARLTTDAPRPCCWQTTSRR